MTYYKIAGCVIAYEPKYELLRRQMEAYRCQEEKADIVLTLTTDFCEEKQRENPHLTVEQCEYIFAGSQFYRKFILHGGFMVHASAIEMDGKAYLFSASSGTGKSTHTKLWQKLFGEERAQILNDDKPALRIEDGICVAYGTPFSGKTDENQNHRVLLQGICMLERGSENRIWKIEPKEAVKLLLQQTILPRNQELVDQLFPMVDQVLKNVPLYRMQCTISEEAARMAYETMSR